MTLTIDTFHTNRLIAERLRHEHLPEYVRLFHNARVMATLSPDGEPQPVEEVARWLQLSLEHWDRYGYGFWLLRTKIEEQFVGRAGLKHVHLDGEDKVELGYALLSESWGQGLATEVSGAILKLAFEQIALTEVVCYTLSTNLPSQRVMEKTGFRFEREGMHIGLPHVFYRLAATDFSARRLRG